MKKYKPRRSLLYMPGANERAMQKAKSIDTDVVIFDLEDAVSPESKALARQQVFDAIGSGGYGHRELVVRVNSLSTEWGRADVERFSGADISAMLFPKVETVYQLEKIDELLSLNGRSDLTRWIMIETPRGVLELETLADHSYVEAIVMGTSDLVKELRAKHTESRSNLDYALQRSVMVARSRGLDVFDGVHLDYQNLDSFRDSCVAGRDIGFDGKTLIHPTQVTVANEVFGFSAEDYEYAKRVLAAWSQAIEAGKGVAVVDGQLVENLHVEESERIVISYEALLNRRD